MKHLPVTTISDEGSEGMSDLGALLKKAREQKGLTLEDIQDMTKIRKRYLEAIEDGDYSVLPGSFYVRAFIKNYSETVGLDSEEVLRLYNKEIPSVAVETNPEPMMKPRRAAARQSDRWSKWGFTLLMWSFLILIGVIIYTYVINQPDSGTNRQADEDTRITTDSEPPDAPNNTNGDVTGPATNGNEPVPDPEPQRDPEPEQPETVLTFVEQKRLSKGGTMDVYTLPPSGIHTYEIKVSGSGSWNEIRKGDSNGEKVHSSTDAGGSTVLQEIEGNVYINVGRADNVEIRIDGILIEDGDRPSSKKFLINVSDDIAPAQ
ncbi:helix-turn-helix domain-containing protein [Paenibacillus tarimensis]